MNDQGSRRVSRRMIEEAASWHLQMQEDASGRTRERFLAWLRRSPQHVAEYMAIARLHGDMRAAAATEVATLDDLRTLAGNEPSVVPFLPGGQPPRHASPRPARGRRRASIRRMGAAAAILLVAAGGYLTWPVAEPPGTRYAAETGGIRTVTLEDDTQLQLAPGSVVDVRFDRFARRIELLLGDAAFDVGRDTARPMTVIAGRQRIDDIGTVFDVSRHADGTGVTVVSGRVTISSLPSPWLDRAHRRLTGNDWPREHVADLVAGDGVKLAADGTLVERHSDGRMAAAPWLPVDIAFHGSSVAEVARRFNAYTATPLAIDDPALARKRISGVFHARDPEAFVSYLGSLPNVRVVREAGRIRFTTNGHPASL